MLYLVSTPIGNLEDITLRALRVLKEVDLILAEDTRKTRRMLKNFDFDKKIISFYEHNETGRIPFVLEKLKEGTDIALVSSAGTPAVSDPGYKLIRACRQEGISVSSVPGPSSVINIIALSSLAHDKFIFIGYMPKKHSARRKLIGQISNLGVAIVFFESPYRLCSSLKDLADICGNKRVTVGREMTKKFESIYEMNIREASEYFQKNKPRGEFTILIEGGVKERSTPQQ